MAIEVKTRKKYIIGSSEEEKKQRQKEANDKYQKSDKYKKYKRNFNRDKVYDRMANYIENYTEDSPESILDKDDNVLALRQKFKDKYGLKIYKKHISI